MGQSSHVLFCFFKFKKGMAKKGLDKCHPKAQVLKDWSPVCDTIERWWKV
jgi:hypothetical protein